VQSEKFSVKNIKKSHVIDVPMTEVQQVNNNNIIIRKEGPGVLYYRISLDYALRKLKTSPTERGFSIHRKYFVVLPDGKTSPLVSEKKGDYEAFQVKVGTKIKVALTIVLNTPKYHVAVVDPLPAGFESINPALKVENQDKSTSHDWEWFYWRWFAHQNLRDDRTEVFAEYMNSGSYSYSYFARAVTVGNFVVGPTHVEEMYDPKIFGQTPAAYVTVFDG